MFTGGTIWILTHGQMGCLSWMLTGKRRGRCILGDPGFLNEPSFCDWLLTSVCLKCGKVESYSNLGLGDGHGP